MTLRCQAVPFQALLTNPESPFEKTGFMTSNETKMSWTTRINHEGLPRGVACINQFHLAICLLCFLFFS